MKTPPKQGRRAVTVWFDRDQHKAIQARASYAGVDMQEYVTKTLLQIADIEPGRTPVILDIDSRDLRDLRAFVSNLLAEDPDADVDSDLLLHLESSVAMCAERARARGAL
jgi:hypothetical protein